MRRKRLEQSKEISDILRAIKYGAKGVHGMFIVRADNYTHCMDLIRVQKSLAESSSFSYGALGELWCGTSIEKFEVLKNKVHIARCVNSKGNNDIVLCYKVTEAIKDKIRFMDAIRWANGCMNNTIARYDLSAYRQNIVYTD